MKPMKSGRLKELQVVECLPFVQGVPGFALPLLEHPTDPRLRTVQEIDEITGLIVGFRVLDGHQASSSLAVTLPELTARVGGEPVHAFIDKSGKARAGTLKQLEGALRDFAKSHPAHVAINLQILELIGTREDKKSARARMRDLIVSASGTNAARAFYEGSTLRTALWQQLLNQAKTTEIAKRILSVRSKLGASVDEDGTIKLDLSALSPKDQATIDQEKLCELLASEFATTPTKHRSASSEDNVAHEDMSNSVEEILRNIMLARRQEERIAILIEAILRDRQSGLAALRKYPRDRAKVANWALHVTAHPSASV
jgi:hypothetical protein